MAVKLAREALGQDPNNLEALNVIVDGALSGRDRRLLEQYPDDVRVLNDLAWILQEHGQRYADALELANKGLRLAPDDLHLLDTRGTILSNLPDRLADARRDFEELVRLSSSDARRRDQDTPRHVTWCATKIQPTAAAPAPGRMVNSRRRRGVLGWSARRLNAGTGGSASASRPFSA